MASSTDLVAIAQEIGKDRIQAYSPFAGNQEPELWMEEVFPSWAMRATRADLYVRIGLFADVNNRGAQSGAYQARCNQRYLTKTGVADLLASHAGQCCSIAV